MSRGENGQPADVAWAHRVNDRWIVHHGLKESACTYLNQLGTSDPNRLLNSCKRARQLVRCCSAGEDPKPWFYAGLFSLATQQEGRAFLGDHWFTANCIPSLATTLAPEIIPSGVGNEARLKALRIRKAIASMA